MAFVFSSSSTVQLSDFSLSSELTKGLVGLNLLLLAGVVASETLQFAYQNPDTLIYTLVGEGVYKHGILPYDYVFDHKPFLIYFFYGPLSFLPATWNGAALLTVVSLLVTAAIVRNRFTGQRWPFAVVLLAMAAATTENVRFSGNSEIVYAPLQLLAVGLLLDSKGRPRRFWGAAAASVAAFNVNYISAVPLMPALLYCLWARADGMRGFILLAAGYASACLALTGGLLGLAAAAGMDVIHYLETQRAFLTGYSIDSITSPSSGLTFLLWLAPFLCLAALPIIPVFRPARADLTKVIALELFILGALVSFFLSGKYFPQYIFPAAAAATVIFLLLRPETLLHRLGRQALLVLVSLYYILSIGHSFVSDWTKTIGEDYVELAHHVSGRPLMTMRSSIVPFYYSGAVPYQPIIWRDHMAVLYGEDNEDAIYAGFIAEGPPFVMTGDWCDRGGEDWTSCALLRESYEMISEQGYRPGAPQYALWRKL